MRAVSASPRTRPGFPADTSLPRSGTATPPEQAAAIPCRCALHSTLAPSPDPAGRQLPSLFISEPQATQLRARARRDRGQASEALAHDVPPGGARAAAMGAVTSGRPSPRRRKTYPLTDRAACLHLPSAGRAATAPGRLHAHGGGRCVCCLSAKLSFLFTEISRLLASSSRPRTACDLSTFKMFLAYRTSAVTSQVRRPEDRPHR